MAQGTFNDDCWKHHTCNIILFCRRYSEGKCRRLAKTKKGRKIRKREWEKSDSFAFFSLPNFSLYCNHKISAIYTADCIYKLRHMIIESFGSEGTPGGFFIYSQQFSIQIHLHHSRTGFRTQMKNNSSIMSLLGNAGKATKSLLKFLGQRPGRQCGSSSPLCALALAAPLQHRLPTAGAS